MIMQMAITLASAASPEIIDSNEECFHGNITGREATRRLKASEYDSHLVRYSQNHKRYILSVLKKGLGQDCDNDLFLEFEICITGSKCYVNGHRKKFRSLKELLVHYETTSLHPSVENIGCTCPSPRFKERFDSKRQGARMMAMEENRRKMKEMEAKIKHLESRRCVIQ